MMKRGMRECIPWTIHSSGTMHRRGRQLFLLECVDKNDRYRKLLTSREMTTEFVSPIIGR